MDTGRRHNISESETKDFIAHRQSCSELHVLLCWLPILTNSLKVTQRVHDGYLGMQWAALKERNRLERFIVCIASESQPALCLGKTLPHSSRLLATNTALRNGSGREWPELCIHGIPRRNMQAHSAPMADCLSQQSIPQPTITHSWLNSGFYRSTPL